MIDIKNYIEAKKAGLISIAKLDSGFAASAKQFDPNTGKEIEPLIAGFHIEDIEKLKTALQETIADFDTLIADAKKL